MKPQIALQLWSVQEDCRNDFKGTLKKVKEMGYDGVEFAGYHGLSAEEVQIELRELDLQVVGSHISYSDLLLNYHEVISFEKATGNNRIICPYAYPVQGSESLEQWLILFETFQSIQKKLTEDGFTFGYHNHDHEFTQLANINLLDELLKLVPEIKIEADIFWMNVAGLNALNWIEENRKNIILLHIKDRLENKKESTEIGSGNIPIEKYVKQAIDFSIPWLIVEQENFKKYTPMESARINRKILEEIVNNCMNEAIDR